MKPVINLDELEYQSNDEGKFQEKYSVISDKIGAKKLGYNITVVPAGKTAVPFHVHHNNEEMFFILEGSGRLRFGDKEYPLRKYDVIACPAGKRDVAHQILNTGSTDLKYMALSTLERTDVCEYPDSNKIGVFVGEQGNRDLRLLFKTEQNVDYFEGEK